MEDDLFNGYGAGMISPGRIAQLAVDKQSTDRSIPTVGKILAKQTEAVSPGSGLNSRIKISPITLPMPEPIDTALDKGISSITNNFSNSTDSTVNNFSNSTSSPVTNSSNSTSSPVTNSSNSTSSPVTNSSNSTGPNVTNSVESSTDNLINESINLTIGQLMSALIKPDKTETSIQNTLDIRNSVISKPSSVINESARPNVVSSQPSSSSSSISNTSNLTPGNMSFFDIVNYPGAKGDMLPRDVLSATASPIDKPSLSNTQTASSGPANVNKSASSIRSSDVLNLVSTSSDPTSNSSTSQINQIGPTSTSLSEYNSGESSESFSSDSTTNFLSAMAQVSNLKSSAEDKSQYAESVTNNKSAANSVSVKTSSPVKNKSLVNQIVNPPNPVAQGVDNLGKVITNTTSTMTSSITDKLSTLTPAPAGDTAQSSQTINNNSTSTISQAGQAEAIPAKSGKAAEDAMVGSPGMSEYYLQAIHDALIVQGIKIRTI